MTDTIKLKMEITRADILMKDIAEKMGITPYSLNKKIHNKTEFKASEIYKLSKLLDIQNVNEIFFAEDGDLKSRMAIEDERQAG